MIDASGGHALEEIITGLQSRGVTVLLCGVGERSGKILDAVGAMAALEAERHTFTSLPEAIEHARAHVERHLSPHD